MGLTDPILEIHQSDQRILYAAGTYINQQKERMNKISMVTIGKVEENGFAERIMRTIENEEVDLSDN